MRNGIFQLMTLKYRKIQESLQIMEEWADFDVFEEQKQVKQDL